MTERETHFNNSFPQGFHHPGFETETEGQDFDFRKYLLALLNRRWMILTITILGLIGTAIYSFIETPSYLATAVLDIDLPSASILLSDNTSQSLFLKNQAFLNTQYRILEGRSLGRKIAQKLNFTASELKKNGVTIVEESAPNQDKRETELNAIVTTILKMLTVTPVPATDLCEISFLTPNAKLSTTLANAWAEEYVRGRFESMQQYTEKTQELLFDQVKSIQKEIEQQQKELRDYSLEKQILKPANSQSLATESLLTLNTSVTQAIQARITAEVRYQALRSTSAENIPDVINSPMVQAAKKQYVDMQQLYQEKLKMYKSDYPEMTRMQGQLQSFQSNLLLLERQVYQDILALAKADYDRAVMNESTLKAQVQEAQKASVQAGGSEVTYDQIRMEIDTKKQLLSALLQKQNQTDVSAQAQEKATAAPTRIMEVAELPTKPYSPDIKNNLIFALLGGLFAGIGLAFVLEFFDRSLKTPADVENQLHLPFLGLVPYYFLENNNNGHNGHKKALQPSIAKESHALERYDKYRLSVHDISSSAAEAVKTIRTSLLLSFPGGPPRSILITSSRSGEGKTFTACNLAIALAHLNKRVLIVDADMRNPHIHRVWNQQNTSGLSIYLTSEAPISAFLRATPIEGLFLFPSGPKTPRPAELLASERFQELIQQLETDFDFVIIDSPPVLPVADSVILASKVKSVMIIVRGGSTPRELVKMAKKKLSASKSVIAGVVLNGIDLADPYYYYRYYSEYYDGYYGNNPTEGTGKPENPREAVSP